MHFKMRCMDRWTQTPNLVFKPTSIVAFAGLGLQERDLIDWGLYRKPGSRIGGYFPVLNRMLKDGGPWHEAPTYPFAHTDIYCMAMFSRYRALYDGKDWWAAKAPNGGSPKGLMDYYIDTAYPIERTGYGRGQVRLVTYGDGATNAKHDLFLVNPAGAALDGTKALVAAYNASGDPRLASFAAMIPDYKPTLIDRRPLPEKIELPAAPSKIWPDYGLAILRAEESPAYWHSDAPVVFQLMTKGYGHDHCDKFNIIFHGAARLLYPDYNAIQYENANIVWTRNTIAHNTLMVDEGDTRSVQRCDVRHAFTPEVKYLATSASGVFEKVDQTRALLLTREYLLDVFHAASPTPRVYDYRSCTTVGWPTRPSAAWRRRPRVSPAPRPRAAGGTPGAASALRPARAWSANTAGNSTRSPFATTGRWSTAASSSGRSRPWRRPSAASTAAARASSACRRPAKEGRHDPVRRRKRGAADALCCLRSQEPRGRPGPAVQLAARPAAGVSGVHQEPGLGGAGG